MNMNGITNMRYGYCFFNYKLKGKTSKAVGLNKNIKVQRVKYIMASREICVQRRLDNESNLILPLLSNVFYDSMDES